MKITEWLFQTMTELGEAGVDSPRRDALVLLEDTLGKDRTWVLAHPEYQLTKTELNTVNKLVSKRKSRVPLAYVRGKAWFYGRFFEVSERVLVPRPESEEIITLAKNLNIHSALDLGTGSGCLAITLALEIPGLKVTASDISKPAVNLAKQNAEKHNVKIKVYKSDLLHEQGLQKKFDLIVANLPYVPEGMEVSDEVKSEPSSAIFGGKDGLNFYLKFWDQIGKLGDKPKWIICESLDSQHGKISKMASKTGYKTSETRGLVQLFKRA